MSARSSFRAAVLAAAVQLLVAAAPVLAQTGSIVGQLVTTPTDRPLAGAAIRLDTVVVVTDERGQFAFREVAAGRRTLVVTRLGYADARVEVLVEGGRATRVRLQLVEAAIRLDTVAVEALTADSLQRRGAGYARGVVTRAELAQWEGRNMSFVDVLRSAVPAVRVRRLERVMGADVCIELRIIPTLDGTCAAPAVYLDGVPITNPTMLFASLDIQQIHRLEVVPSAEAGVRYGTGALHGALLIETRRPGGDSDRPRQQLVTPRVNFDWSQDTEGHSTELVLAASALGNAAGVAAGLAIARQCLRLRTPSNDALISDCDVGASVSAGLAAVLLPALGSSFGSSFAGSTRDSRGRWAPAAVASAMVVVPGYAVTLSGRRNSSDTMETVGHALIVLGGPLASTLADYLFRRLR